MPSAPSAAVLILALVLVTAAQQGFGNRGLPECANQQVCAALHVPLNRSQSLCACPGSACTLRPGDRLDDRSVKLVSQAAKKDKTAYSLVKVCEPVSTVRRCRAPRDWQLLALQSVRTGRAHYLVVCRCPTGANLLGPVRHASPPYANIPGIRVYGMLCHQQLPRTSRVTVDETQTTDLSRDLEEATPEVPWPKLLHVLKLSGLRPEPHPGR
ncbi:uncharacterized protein LOC135388909 [Ornithodoros turicata]|uniref:uncharacterized protein LOC135388909 n=1 Tax=Ornithodoros turicata TaxID=34597 RepID=UPI0031394E19